MTERKLSNEELKIVLGGTNGGTQCSVKAVGSADILSGKQAKCPKCGSISLVDQMFSTDNGRTVYNGQECTCGYKLIYGENIM